MTYNLIYLTQKGERVAVAVQAATDAQAEYAAQHLVPPGATIEEIELPKAA